MTVPLRFIAGRLLRNFRRKRPSFEPETRRRLYSEELEARLCLSAIRVVAWNTANGPNNSTEDAFFRTVFEAIGEENVGGNVLPPSIVALQETDNLQFGGNSIARIESILESLYPGSSYDRAVTTLDSGDDATGFVYDNDVFDLVSTSVVAPTQGMTPFAHHILRGQFRPQGSDGDDDFYLYTTHLKAGSSGTDQGRRTAEAAAIRLDIDALGPGEDVLVMGDFNISGSSEGAYRNFLASGNGQLFDPIDQPGEWKNNPAFVNIHTQNPAINGPGGMDDRFDFHLASAAVFDDAGLQYIEGSYRAFGNNGTHQFNSDITTGTGAAPNVLTALAAASDHLPVVADYEIDLDLAGITIVETEAATVVREGGLGDSYSVVLNTIPTSNVTITIATDGETLVDGSVSKTLTFTPANALIPQSVSVVAVDDATGEGSHQSQITHTVTSDDDSYDRLIPNILSVSVVDNDTPNVVISEIMYNSASNEPAGEWVEIINLGPGEADISGWVLDDEDETNWSAIPNGTPALSAGDVAIIHNEQITSSTFRARWSVPSESQVIAVTWSSLANGPSPGNEMLVLRDGQNDVQDSVNYDDDGVIWPSDNNSASIYLPDPFADNDVGGNWERSQAGEDAAVSPSGSPFDSRDVGSPGVVAGVNFTPPKVVETRFDQNAGTESQRSLLRSVTVRFDQIVEAQPGGFELKQRGDLSPGDAEVSVNVLVSEVNGATEAKLTFAGRHVDQQSGSLTDGNYELTLNAQSIVNATGIALDGNDDGVAGGNAVIGDDEADAFFRLFGDSDGDRDVDGQDYGRFGQTFLRSSGQANFDPRFDWDADGDIDGQDYGRFGTNFLLSLPFA